jgi:MarR family transcriptional regulator for hemolysin
MVRRQTFSAVDFGRRLYRLGQNWRRQVDGRVRQFGLTDATWRPLLHLGRFGDGVRQTDLAASLAIEGPSLVRLLDALERTGLLERQEDADDRRSKTLRLTSAGLEIYQKIAVEYEAIGRALLKDITTADIGVCERVFDRIERNVARVTAARDGDAS